MQFKVKKHCFPTYCTLLLLFYASPFWNASIFTKLIILRSEACSDWPAIHALWLTEYLTEMSRPFPYCDAVARVLARWHKNNETLYKWGICCIQWEKNDWFYCLITAFLRAALQSGRINITMSAFVIGETANNKYYSTLLKTCVWIVSGKFFK